MKVLTLNIDFKGLTTARIQKIIALIHHHNPDVIFLQEVPREMVEHFLQMEEYPFHLGTKFQHPYDTLILSRFPCIRYDRIPLPETNMGRNLLFAQIVLPSGKTIFVGTFHCDSVFGKTGSEQETLKLDQLSFIGSILEDKPFIIAGDTNMTDNRKTTIPTLNELDSPATFKKNRFVRALVSPNFLESTTKVVGGPEYSDHIALLIEILSINLPEQ
jgi:endonuclease/exonuclease/phosphatase family metal-dependent hydrolase